LMTMMMMIIIIIIIIVGLHFSKQYTLFHNPLTNSYVIYRLLLGQFSDWIQLGRRKFDKSWERERFFLPYISEWLWSPLGLLLKTRKGTGTGSWLLTSMQYLLQNALDLECSLRLHVLVVS
jgi:hypothetical protein